MEVRLIPGEGGLRKIEAVKVIRQFTGYPLKEAKDVMECSEEFEVGEAHLLAFLHSAQSCDATVVIGDKHVPTTPTLQPTPVGAATAEAILTELRDLRREIAGLRKHLGMIAHE